MMIGFLVFFERSLQEPLSVEWIRLSQVSKNNSQFIVISTANGVIGDSLEKSSVISKKLQGYVVSRG